MPCAVNTYLCLCSAVLSNCGQCVLSSEGQAPASCCHQKRLPAHKLTCVLLSRCRTALSECGQLEEAVCVIACPNANQNTVWPYSAAATQLASTCPARNLAQLQSLQGAVNLSSQEAVRVIVSPNANCRPVWPCSTVSAQLASACPAQIMAQRQDALSCPRCSSLTVLSG